MPELTVGEAIDLLQKYPRELRILVDGYEAGFDDPEITEEMIVRLKTYNNWEGPYATYKEGGGHVAGYFIALVFGRNKQRG